MARCRAQLVSLSSRRAPCFLIVWVRWLVAILRQPQLPASLLLYFLNGSTWMVGLKQGLSVFRVIGKQSQGCDQGCRTTPWQTNSFAPCNASRPLFTRIAITRACHKVHTLA